MVRFQTEHRFGAPGPAVVTLLADPAFYLGLTLPDLGQPEVLEEHDDESSTVIRLRYEYQGSLDPIVLRLLGSRQLRWIQEVRVDLSTSSGSLHFEVETDPRRLHGAATFVVTTTAAGSVRHLDGDLVVSIPGIGRMAERRIVPGVLQRLDIEAQGIDDRLRPG